MAERRWYATPTADIATGTSAKTVLQVKASGTRVALVDRGGISFEGITPTDAPILVELIRQTTAGTRTALTTVKHETGQTAVGVTAGHTATVEPTTDVILASMLVHPQGGRWEFQLPPSMAYHLNPDEYLGMRTTAAVTVDCRPWMSGVE